MPFIGLVTIILLSSCGGEIDPNPQLAEVIATTNSVVEIINVNNCGNLASAEQISEHFQSIIIEGAAELGVDYKVLEASVSVKYARTSGISKSHKVIAAPETNMEFTLLWTEQVDRGMVTIESRSGRATYRVSTPIAVEQISATDLSCGASTTSPTFTPSPTAVVSPTPDRPTQQPIPPEAAAPYVKGYVTIEALGTRHISLAAGELIVGTADRFQEDVNKPGQPPCTAFLIRGPIEMDLTLWYGGWDHWANVYDAQLLETLLKQKEGELQQHQTCPSRGIVIVRLP